MKKKEKQISTLDSIILVGSIFLAGAYFLNIFVKVVTVSTELLMFLLIMLFIIVHTNSITLKQVGD